MKAKTLLPLNLQFFADGDSGSTDTLGNTDNTDTNNNEDDGEGEDEDHADDKHGKTFTQEEVNKMCKREKRQGKASVLKALGFKSEEEAVKAVNLLKTLTDSTKSDEENAKDAKEGKDKSDKRAEIAEAKLSCFYAGVNKDSIDDVIAIAITKIDDDNDLDDVLKEMKKDKRYSLFFGNNPDEDEEEDEGTGTMLKHSKSSKQGNETNYGEMLAKSNPTTAKSGKSNFFN